VAEHVVEAGPNISDNLRVGLTQVTLEVFVTNEPIDQDPQWGSGSTSAFGQVSTPAPDQDTPLPTLVTVPQWFSLPIGIPGVGALISSLVNPTETTFKPNIGLQPTPGFAINPTVLQFSDAFDAVQQTHDQLEILRQAGTLLTVYGSKGVYSPMAIEEWGMQRNSETGTGATFTIQLKEIRQVTTSVSTATPTVPRAIAAVSNGQQATTDANSGQISSVLSQIVQLFQGTTPPSPP
jgi:hypothetical protein